MSSVNLLIRNSVGCLMKPFCLDCSDDEQPPLCPKWNDVFLSRYPYRCLPMKTNTLYRWWLVKMLTEQRTCPIPVWKRSSEEQCHKVQIFVCWFVTIAPRNSRCHCVLYCLPFDTDYRSWSSVTITSESTWQPSRDVPPATSTPIPAEWTYLT